MPPRKQKPPPPPPITFPARPMNGGKLEFAEELDPEEWRYRPKYNGRRVLLHVPTMRTWNRQLEENNWIFPAFHKLSTMVELQSPTFEWLDIELLYGKTSVAKRALIVLDYVSANETWWDRQMNLQSVFGGCRLESVYQLPEHDSVNWSPPLSKLPSDTLKTWLEMQALNQDWGCTFYEGLVAYDVRSKYPIQLFSPKKETRHWIKYRFIT